MAESLCELLVLLTISSVFWEVVIGYWLDKRGSTSSSGFRKVLFT